ncbi:uncharacterized protein [Oscarella lobularis]|uniref:uncharacterized protein n=1 Tax=Oscarella lobularis TaxID=121494 RepID=UPI0033134DD6
MALGVFSIALLIAIVFVCLMVTFPLILELLLNLIQALGFRPWRSLHITRMMTSAMKVSDKAEYLVMVSVFGLISLPIYFHFSHVVPFFTNDYPETSWLPLSLHLAIIHYVPSIYLNSNMFYHFIKIIIVSPGFTKDQQTQGSDEPSSRWCAECKRAKPPRAHHCFTCDGCVLKHDHHCIFAANCIGLNNAHNFFLFVFYCAMSCLYAVYVSKEPYKYCKSISSQNNDVTPVPGSLDDLCQDYGGGGPLFWLSTFSAAVLCTFFGLIFHVSCAGQTLHEFLKHRVWKRNQKQKANADSSHSNHATHLTIDSTTEDSQQRDFPTGWLQNLESTLGPKRYWWRWLLPLPFFHSKRPHQKPYHHVHVK